MDMWSGIASLTVAFVLIVGVLIWLFIESKNKMWIKVLLIPLCVWYGLALYFTPQNLMGWPTPTEFDNLPDNSIVVGIRVVETNNKSKGAIYFWMIQLENKEVEKLNKLHPAVAFNQIMRMRPRAYEVPYTRELHKRIAEAQRKKGDVRGAMVYRHGKGKEKKEGSAYQGNSAPRGQLDVLNPAVILKKDD
jgi:hypothetical protein